MKLESFKQLIVWQRSIELAKEVYRVTDQFPKSELFILSDQILRAVDSVCLNIAEGSNRATDKDFAHFLNQSLTSLEEVMCCLDLALSDNYINETEFNYFVGKGEILGKQLIGFQNKLRT